MELLHGNDSFSLVCRGQVILSHTPENPMVYVGCGKETVDMYLSLIHIF